MSKVGMALYSATQLNSFVRSKVIDGLRGNFELSLLSTQKGIAKALIDDYGELTEEIRIPEFIRRLSSFVQMVALWKFKDRSMNHLVRAMASFGTKEQRRVWKCVVVSEMNNPFLKRIIIKGSSFGPCFLLLRLLEHFLLEILLVERFRRKFKKMEILLIPFSGHIGADFGILVWIAKRLGVKAIALQENWDNLSTKTFILEEPDYFLVWGEQSAGHVRSIHRLFNVEVSIVGSPRFSPYFDMREAVPSVSIGNGDSVTLDNGKFVLVAGTGDGIDDEMLVRTVAGTISSERENQRIAELKIVYRPHPMTRTSSNYLSLQHDLGNLLIDNGPDSRRFGHHNALVKSSALVINHFSTLTLESLLCGTPVLVPLFLGRPEAKYRYEHILKEWHHMMGVGLISQIRTPRTPEEFRKHLTEVLQEGVIEVGTEINLDWICKKGDYVKEVSKFIDSSN